MFYKPPHTTMGQEGTCLGMGQQVVLWDPLHHLDVGRHVLHINTHLPDDLPAGIKTIATHARTHANLVG
jgi:hypothetical protein